MSNNQIKKNTKIQNMPKLRFSEFNEEKWEIMPLNSLFEFKTTNTFSRDLLNYDSGSVKNIHYGDIHTKFSTLFNLEKEKVPFINQDINLERISNENYCQEGDLVFADASEDLKDVGKHIEIINLNNQKVLSGTHTLLARKINDKIITGFAGFLFNSTYIRQQIQKESQGTKVMGISSTRLANILIYFPKSKAEQKKITTFLSSLEELIKNESSKLETYKQYKHGLLKQLFPHNEKSLSELRFVGFNEKWEKIELSKIAKSIKTKNTNKNKILVLSLSNEYGLVSQADYFQKKIAGNNTDKYIILQKNDFVYNDRITKNSTYGTIKRLSFYDEGIVSPIYKCFRFKKNQNPIFWEYYFESKSHENEIRKIINEGARAGRYNISIDSFLSINVMLPSKLEQDKIALCLTSLDEIITCQNSYIKYLKEHKKGLMQQLFPVF